MAYRPIQTHCQQKWRYSAPFTPGYSPHSYFPFRQKMRNGPPLNWSQRNSRGKSGPYGGPDGMVYSIMTKMEL